MELDSIFPEMGGAADGVTWPLVSRYCSGDATAEEVEVVRRWIGTDLARQQELEFLRRVWGESSEVMMRPREKGNVEQVLAVLAGRMRGSGVAAREEPARPALRRIDALGTQPLRRSVWSAASVLILAIVMLAIRWGAQGRLGNQHTAADMLVYTTGNGERASITLPDGGTVALNVASRLEVPVDYMAGHRTLRLVGEGLFTVSHRVSTPLAVSIGQTTIRVLGTSFIVRRYASDTAAIVAVQDGKVAVGSTVVTANRLVEVGRTGVIQGRAADPSLFTFSSGTLTLTEVTLKEAIADLDRWYNADIRLGDPALARRKMGGEYAQGSLAELSDILAGTLNLRVVRVGRVLTLYPR